MNFDFDSLTGYFQIAIALNLAPSLSDGIFGSYLGLLKSLVNIIRDKMSLRLDNQVEFALRPSSESVESLQKVVEKFKGVNINLPEDGLDVIERQHEQWKAMVNVKKEALKDELDVILNQEVESYEERLVNDSINLKGAFIISAIFCFLFIGYPVVVNIFNDSYCVHDFYLCILISILIYLFLFLYILFEGIKNLINFIRNFCIIISGIILYMVFNMNSECATVCTNVFYKPILCILLICSILPFIIFPFRYRFWIGSLERNVDIAFRNLEGIASTIDLNPSFFKRNFTRRNPYVERLYQKLTNKIS